MTGVQTCALPISPNAGSTFTAWAGCDSTVGPECTVTLTTDRTVTATFTLVPRTLTVGLGGSGTGNATGGGFNCGAGGVICVLPFNHGTVVTVNATPSSGSTATWASCDTTAGTQCTVTMTTDRTVTATFTALATPNPRTLTVVVTGNGTGTVTSSPLGIICGSDGTECISLFDAGDLLTLTATAEVGSEFQGWSHSACPGTAPCSVNITADLTVTATFAQSFGNISTDGLGNISTRGKVLTGDDVMIGGFIIESLAGSDAITILIRARGPSLGAPPFNVPGPLANPTMELFSGPTKIAQNYDWQTTDPLCLAPALACGSAADIRAATFQGASLNPCAPNPDQTLAPPGCEQEAALLVTLPAGPFTAIVSGVGGTVGISLIEVTATDSRLSAIVSEISGEEKELEELNKP